MSEQRLIDANFFAECISEAANRLVSEYGSGSVTNTLIALSEGLTDGRFGITVDAVPREEHESLLKRFRHLLESDYIRSFDEVKHGTGEYKRDIREADRERPRGRWGYRAYRTDARITVTGEMVCSHCHASFFRVAASWFNYCPRCGANMKEVHE